MDSEVAYIYHLGTSSISITHCRFQPLFSVSFQSFYYVSLKWCCPL